MPPLFDEVIISGHTADSAVSVHVFFPFALKRDICDPENYFCEELQDGTEVSSEWDPKSRESMRNRLEKIKWVSEVVCHKITVCNFRQIIGSIQNSPNVVILNLTDGVESDGWPGSAVVKCLEESGIAFTGAASDFLALDTSKTSIKKCLTETRATPGYYDLSVEPEDPETALLAIGKLKMPIIVKPCPSSGSRGITNKSVLWNTDNVLELARTIRQDFGGCYVEEFIAGREFSALVSGDAKSEVRTYPVMERVFSSEVDLYQQFLSYDMKWVEWGLHANSGKKWWPSMAPEHEQSILQGAARAVFLAVGGCGYCRMDMRMDLEGHVYVIDVNANCSVDCEEGSSMGLILQAAGLTLEDFLEIIIKGGLERRDQTISLHSSTSATE